MSPIFWHGIEAGDANGATEGTKRLEGGFVWIGSLKCTALTLFIIFPCLCTSCEYINALFWNILNVRPRPTILSPPWCVNVPHLWNPGCKSTKGKACLTGRDLVLHVGHCLGIPSSTLGTGTMCFILVSWVVLLGIALTSHSITCTPCREPWYLPCLSAGFFQQLPFGQHTPFRILEGFRRLHLLRNEQRMDGTYALCRRLAPLQLVFYFVRLHS